MPGTHGSLNKAGKVRKLTPKVERKPKKKLPPRLRLKRNFFRIQRGAYPLL